MLATVENVQPEANVDAQKAAIAAAKTDISSYIAAENTADANLEKSKADLEQKKLDFDRYTALYNEKLVSKQDFDAKKSAYDVDVATVAQNVAALAQAKAQTDSARGHLGTQIATLRSNEDSLNKTVSVAPFDGIVTNEPVREGETVVVGIQNAQGSTLMTLADMSVITAEVKVDETDIVNVALGQPADVSVDALPGKVFKGHVTEVGDQALLRSTGVATSTDHQRHRRGKRLQGGRDHRPEHSDELRPGLSSTAKITTARKPNALTVPIQALDPLHADAGCRQSVHVMHRLPPAADRRPQPSLSKASSSCARRAASLKAIFVPVTTGITGATDIEVTSGLECRRPDRDRDLSGPSQS